jgi:hypothetical protein
MDQESRDAFKNECREKHKRLDLQAMAKHMRKLEAEKDKLDAKLADVDSEYDILRMESIPEKMDEEGVTKITFAGIGRIQLTADILCNQVTDAKPLFFAWLDDHGYRDIVQPNINPSTLKAFVKARLKEGTQLPEEFVKVTPITRASIVKV